MAEKLFFAFLLRISGKNVSPPPFFGIRSCKWTRSKACDVPNSRSVSFFRYRFSMAKKWRRKEALSPQKSKFPVSGKTGNRSGNFSGRPRSQSRGASACQVLSRCAKPFGLQARNRQTDKRTSQVAKRTSAGCCQSEIPIRWRKILNALLIQNFLLYTTVQITSELHRLNSPRATVAFTNKCRSKCLKKRQVFKGCHSNGYT